MKTCHSLEQSTIDMHKAEQEVRLSCI